MDVIGKQISICSIVDQGMGTQQITLSEADFSVYDKCVLVIRFNQPPADLFDDETLACILDDYPEELLDICTHGSYTTCERNSLNWQGTYSGCP